MHMLVRGSILSAFLALSSAAHAACPWGSGEVETVFATMTTITINGKMFSVKGEAARAQFQADLAECDAGPQASHAFREWRKMRRLTNWTGGIGICCLWPALLATPVTAYMAGEKKEELMMALQAGS